MKIMALTGIPTDGSRRPGWFLLPDSAILRSGNPFFIPEFDNDFRGYPTLIIKLDRLGKSISPRFAYRYFEEATLGIMIRGEETLAALRKGGMPWTEAVVFDRCCLMGDFHPFRDIFNSPAWRFTFGDCMAESLTRPDEKSIGEIIASLSENNTIKTGDLLLIPLTEEGIRLNIGETIVASIDTDTVLEVRVR